jgi:formylglycine-generating enzyme required for sulfatase activity
VRSATQRLRWIPPGRFLMGLPDRQGEPFRDGAPVHSVVIARGFWLFDTPCTQALFKEVTDENPSRFKSRARPVESVSFQDIETFLAALNALIPGFYLPSEAQWEYACRAGTKNATHDADLGGMESHAALNRIAWYSHSSDAGFDTHGEAGTRPVGLKAPNPWGLYDMLGNVWEWCEDNWHARFEGAPVDGSAWFDIAVEDRVVRGGSWSGAAGDIRATSRDHVEPGYRDDDIGLRCLRFD